jgi:nucleotide-binding universal stress UspA family protein
MAIRTILVGVSGGNASAGAVETALALAGRLKAHVEGFHARIDERSAVMGYGDVMGAPYTGDLVQRVAEEAKAAALAARRLFDEAVGRHGLPLNAAPPPPGAGPAATASAAWREEIGYAPDLIAYRARSFDLVVLGRSDRGDDEPHSDDVESAVLASGRPVFLAPAKVQESGRHIAIGWNGAVEAVHALAAALPLLATAEKVDIITIGSEDEGLGAAAVEHLAWHGIAAATQFVLPVSGVGPGEQLLATARDVGADLLVMGAYGHAPWRELLFGGATREVVGTSLMPLLLAH